MALINWNDSYSVKIREIDNQHRELVNILNELYEAMNAQKGSDILGRVILKLITYTKQHFATEEGYMQRFGYPDYAAHKREHEAFTQKVLSFKQDFDAGKVAMSVQITAFLRDWLVKHISGVDKKYSDFFNSKGLI